MQITQVLQVGHLLIPPASKHWWHYSPVDCVARAVTTAQACKHCVLLLLQ